MIAIRRITAAAGAAIVAVLVLGPTPQAAAATLTVGNPTEVAVTPEPPFGGRTMAIAIDPSNAAHVFAATEQGGLWERTANLGRWFKAPFFTEVALIDVKFNPANPAQVIVTTADDRRKTTKSVAWVSNDHGRTWGPLLTVYNNQPIGYPLCGPVRVNGGQIAFAGTSAYVATSCGLFANQGQGWALVAFGNYTSVVVDSRDAGGVVCGNGIIKTRDSHAGSWNSRTWPGGLQLCSAALAPYDSRVIVITGVDGNGVSKLYESDEGAGFWADITPAGWRTQNRAPFVAMTPDRDGFSAHAALYWGDGFAVYRTRCTANQQTDTDCNVTPETEAQCTDALRLTVFPYTVFGRDDDGDGIVNDGCPAVHDPEKNELNQCKANGDDDLDGAPNDGCPILQRIDTRVHPDPTSIAFDAHQCPVWITSDGGVERSTNCGQNFTDFNAGLHALEAYNVTGTTQYATGLSPSHQDLYFGTQDNDAYATTSGTTWNHVIENQDVPWMMANPVSTDAQAQVLWAQCTPCNTYVGQRGAAQGQLFQPPPGAPPQLPARWGDIGRQRVGADTYVVFGRGLDSNHYGLYLSGPETGAQCQNNSDDDGDGIANDGCQSNGGAETGTQCHDQSDSDNDGVVNDGCSDLFSSESGATECSGAADNDHDGVVNDGCPPVRNPAVGPPETGMQCDGLNSDSDTVIDDGCPNAVPESDSQCLNPFDDDGDGVVNDGCMAIGVWRLVSTASTSPLTADGVPFMTQSAITGFGVSVYFAQTKDNAQAKLLRIDNALSATPTMTTLTGGTVGAVRVWTWGFVTRAVYAVDPLNGLHVVAADSSGRLFTTINGGASWSSDPLSPLVLTQNNEFLSEPTAIGILPSNSGSLVLVGTMRAGIAYSPDRGLNWGHVAGSEEMPFVSSFYFDAAQTAAWVTSIGRGLWKIPIVTAPPPQ